MKVPASILQWSSLYAPQRHIRHIRPLWVTQSENSQIQQTKCEVDTGAGSNVLPTHKAKYLFGEDWLRTLVPPRVQIEAYGGETVCSLGSCVLHQYIDNKAFPTIFEVTNMTGKIFLGMMQAKALGYVKFLQTEWACAFKICTTTLKKIVYQLQKCNWLI